MRLEQTKTKMKSKSIFSSIAIIIGTAVGAGIFALPYAISKSGVGIGIFYLLFLGIISIILVLAYGEVVLRTPERLQIIGYTKKYLGDRWRVIAMLSFLIGITGALIAYTIVVGEFIETIAGTFGNWDAFEYGLVYFAVVALVILAGLGMVVSLERIMVVFLIAVVGIIIILGVPQINAENLTTFNPLYMFLPYGVILFAISSASVIPDACEALKEKKHLFRAIKIGMVIPLIIYALFSIVIVGITGTATHEGAIPGLQSYLGQWVIYIGTLFGIISMTTSFLALGLVVREIYQLDFRMPKIIAWLMAMLPPLIIYIFHLTTFISIISLVGGVMGGFNGIIIILLWRKARKIGKRQPENKISIPIWLQVVMIAVFITGIFYELYFQFIVK